MLSHSSGYAVRALAYLANRYSNSVLVRDIAEGTNIPAPYLSKIINTLARKRLVVTRRGIGGGVILAVPPEAISLYDVCIALEDPLIEERCMLSEEPCSSERACPAHHFCVTYRQQQHAFLKATTISEVAAFEQKELVA